MGISNHHRSMKYPLNRHLNLGFSNNLHCDKDNIDDDDVSDSDDDEENMKCDFK